MSIGFPNSGKLSGPHRFIRREAPYFQLRSEVGSYAEKVHWQQSLFLYTVSTSALGVAAATTTKLLHQLYQGNAPPRISGTDE